MLRNRRGVGAARARGRAGAPRVCALYALLALPEAGLSSQRGACAGGRRRQQQRGSIVALAARRRQRLLACGGGGGPSRRSRRLGGTRGSEGRGAYCHGPAVGTVPPCLSGGARTISTASQERELNLRRAPRPRATETPA